MNLIGPDYLLEIQTVKSLIAEKIRRAKSWKPYVPFDMAEHEANKEGSFVNKFLFRVGTNDNYNKIRSWCKAEGVSVGSLGLASSFMAMACVNASSTGEECYRGHHIFSQNLRVLVSYLNTYVISA